MGFFANLIDRIITASTWLKAILWFVASQVVYFIMILVTIPAVEKQAKGMKVFDLMPLGYSPKYAVNLLESLGDKGRDIYLTQQIPFDMIYPGLMGFSGVLFIALIAKKVNHRYGKLMILPILAAAFDYLENTMVSVMIFTFPHVPKLVFKVSNVFTILKSVLTVLYLVVLIILFSILLYKFLSRHKKTEESSGFREGT